jgi:hypothetical protein
MRHGAILADMLPKLGRQFLRGFDDAYVKISRLLNDNETASVGTRVTARLTPVMVAITQNAP